MYCRGNPIRWADPSGYWGWEGPPYQQEPPTEEEIGVYKQIAKYSATAAIIVAGSEIVIKGLEILTGKNEKGSPLVPRVRSGEAGFAKGGKQNLRDSGLVNRSDEEILNDLKNASGKEKTKLVREAKARGLRNVQKRGGEAVDIGVDRALEGEE